MTSQPGAPILKEIEALPQKALGQIATTAMEIRTEGTKAYLYGTDPASGRDLWRVPVEWLVGGK